MPIVTLPSHANNRQWHFGDKSRKALSQVPDEWLFRSLQVDLKFLAPRKKSLQQVKRWTLADVGRGFQPMLGTRFVFLRYFTFTVSRLFSAVSTFLVPFCLIPALTERVFGRRQGKNNGGQEQQGATGGDR
jgi:hypothetical protein